MFSATSLLQLPREAFFPVSLPLVPGPEHFWTLLVWVVLPTVATVWGLYFHRHQELRRLHRRLRQLEIRLAAATPRRPAARSGTSTNRVPAPFRTTAPVPPPSRSTAPVG